MQTVQMITAEQLREVIAAVYEQGPVVVRQTYSEFGQATKEVKTPEALGDELTYQPGVGDVVRLFTLYYPEAKGHSFERRINLDPAHCNGHTYRFSQEGWGLIHLQVAFQKHPLVECRVAVNSQSRATTWSDTCHDLHSPASWDWKVVERKAGRLIRLLRRQAKSNTTSS